MKKILVILFFLIISAVVFSVYRVNKLINTPYSKSTGIITKKTITISKGQPAKNIALKLEKKGIIFNKYIFLLWLYIDGKINKLRYGEFELTNKDSIKQIARLLTAGKTKSYKVTIPEGLDYKKIAGLFEQENMADSGKFIKLCENTVFVGNLLKEQGLADYIRNINNINNIEGFLYPETYYFSREITEKDIIETMVSFFKKFTGNYLKKETVLNMDIYEVLTLASIIEKEAIFNFEKPRIAGVYINRLERGMKLEADPTIQYAQGFHKKRLLYKDLEIESPYNTYKYEGLPPGPICNPGIESIKSVYEFEQHKYLYFVADNTGRHIFSSSSKQHNRNKIKVKRMRKKRKFVTF